MARYADRYFTRSFVPLRDADGHVNGVLASGYEVTEEVRARHAHQEAERRNQAELQRLVALLEEAPVLINVLEGPELRIVMMNRRTRELLRQAATCSASRSHDLVPPSNPTLAGRVPRLRDRRPRDVRGAGPRRRGLRRPLVLHHGRADPRRGPATSRAS